MISITAVPRRFATAVKRHAPRALVAAAAGAPANAAAPPKFAARLLSQATAPSHMPAADAALGNDNELPQASAEQAGDNLVGERLDSWYTGKTPSEAPGRGPDGPLHALPLPRMDGSASREQVRAAFDNIWAIDETLMGGIQSEEAFHRPPYHDLRHPMIFYYGHTASVFVNKLRVAGALRDPVNAYFESIFETGVDEMSWDDLSKNHMEWPSVAEVHAYRQVVYDLVTGIIDSHPDLDGRAFDASSQMWALHMGMEHQKIHVETSSVLIRELPVKYVRKPEGWAAAFPSADEAVREPQEGVHYPANEMVHVPAGPVTMGKDQALTPTYGWDNEYGERTFQLGGFAATKNMITNGEYLEFVLDGGYATESLWEPDGWNWRTFRNARWPCWWVKDGPAGIDHYRLRTIFDERPMPWDWPVDVNYHEAKAFCNWQAARRGLPRGALRMMTEPEHYAIRDPPPAANPGFDAVADATVTGRMADDCGANLQLSYGSQTPVGHFPPTAAGFHDAMGSAWEWGEGHYCALPGFRVHKYYEDFSSPCFDGKHNMILGGSFVSMGANGASRHSRFAFRPHFFQHAGFRVVQPDAPDSVPTSCEGSPGPHVGSWRGRVSAADEAASALREERELNNVMASQYGAPVELAWAGAGAAGGDAFAQDLAALAAAHADGRGKALDVGCSVGRSTFELAREGFQQVVGMDISEPAVAAASALQKGEAVPYELRTEGDVAATAEARAPDGVDLSSVEFMLGDAMCIPAHFSGFDCVLLANVIDEMPSPSGPLSRMGGTNALVNPGGVVVVATPCTWVGGNTPKESWLGGFAGADGGMVSTADGIGKALGPDFELVEKTTLLQVVPQNQRAYELIAPEVTVWKRRG